MLYGNPFSGGQPGWLILYGAWCWPPFFHPAQLWPLPPSPPVYDMATKCVRASRSLIQKLTKRSVAELCDLKLKLKRNTKLDDPELLICKTNARRHARREKNATMVKCGSSGQRTNLDIRVHSGTVFSHQLLHTSSTVHVQSELFDLQWKYNTTPVLLFVLLRYYF